ncbi:MAG TPA: hypothetical protein VG944_24785 [Fimbriimonas sp.]|nr:hypothetical protein [Fimbriimonas sp.]
MINPSIRAIALLTGIRMAFKEVSSCFLLICACVIAGCSGDTAANNPPTADQLKAAEQKNVQNIENNSQLTPEQKRTMEAHMGGGPSSEASSRAGDLHKR